MTSNGDTIITSARADSDRARIDTTADNVRMGSIVLRSWQVVFINRARDVFMGTDCYLVRINYEVDLPSEPPGLYWFEIAFDFAGEQNERVTIVDAVPRASAQPYAATAYTLNDHMSLVPCAGGSSVHAHVPAESARTNVSGIGGQHVRWWHAALPGDRIRCGSYFAWLVLAVPTGSRDVTVRATARQNLAGGGGPMSQPPQRPVAFTVTFPEERVRHVPIGPSLTLGSRSTGTADRQAPRVFISYAHDTAQHKAQALAFGNLLRECRIDTHMDQWYVDDRRDWSLWAIRQVNAADFVMVLASPVCKAVGDGAIDPRWHRGLQSEMAILREKLHSRRELWERKLLPVVLPGEVADHLPLFLQPWTADHYAVDELSKDGISDLLRVLWGRSLRPRPGA